MSAREAHCSFCGRAARKTSVMLAGPVNVFICTECVFDAVGQVAEIRTSREADKKLFADAKRCTFCTPEPLQ